MRKLLCALLLAFVSFCATAQNAKNVLEIDPASFRPVQTGTLTGVAIDKIAKDRSQRECARIKLHVNRMTREEIEQLQVHIIGGMVALTKRELAYEGNGLIIEMTAKPQTRFYLHHDKYGDSNEVTVDLEGNKEYFLDAHLNYYYSITVRSNTADVEVYLDGVLRGRTNSNNLLTVEKVFPGEHRLQMKYGGSEKEKIINVNSQEVFFEQYVDIAGRIPQDVVFEIRPVTAVLKFEGEILPLDEGGAALKTVAQGTYKYSIEADEYHPYSGTVTVEDQMVRLPIINLRPAFGYLAVEGSSVRDAKLYVDSKLVGTLPLSAPLKLASGAHEVQIVKAKYKGYSTTVNISDDKTETITPTLEANFANVTLTASEGVEIVINNQSRGTGRWSGELAMGQYRVECRKAGHKPSQQSLNISSAAPVALRLNDPEPIYGSVRVVSNPLLGTVKVDGRTVGETPRNVERLLVGKHTVEVSKSGYRTWSREITITEGPMQTITVALEKIASATPTTTTSASTSISWSSSNTSGKTYKVGDYYNDGKKEGVVFWVDESGKHGKIVSLTESSGELAWSSDSNEQKRLIGADDKNNGANNMAKVKQIYGWQSKYPAFKWCADLGEGWYLPAIEELKIFALNASVHDAVNQTLASKGKKLANKGDQYYYWSSTEDNYQFSSGGFCAWGIRMYDGVARNFGKSGSFSVRAVSAVNFEDSRSQVTTTIASKQITMAPYKVGDYYNDGKKEGVVFQVWDGGKHGKIVSLTESRTILQWSSDSNERKRLIGADDEYNGANNMAKVKQISGWESKYPAFKWCSDLGEGWYLPAIEELELFTLNRSVYDAVNQTLASKDKKLANKGDSHWYWSSTEYNYQSSSGEFCVWYVGMDGGYTSYRNKYYYYYVRAVSAF